MENDICSYVTPPEEKARTNEIRHVSTLEWRAMYARASAKETKDGSQTLIGGVGRGSPRRLLAQELYFFCATGK